MTSRLFRENRAKDVKTLKNWEEFVAKKQIKLDQQELINWLCIKRGILRLWVSCWLRFGNYRTKWIPCQTQESHTILKQRAALERPTFPVNPLPFGVPEPCLASIRDCRMTHGILWVPQETLLNDYLLEKDYPLLSSKIQRIWHHLLEDWDLKLQEIQWYRKGKWDENRRIRQHLYHASKVEVEYRIILVELILTVVWFITREFQSQKFIWESFQTLGISKLESQPHLTMHWTKEVEKAKSIDELMTSRTIMVRTDFPDYDMLDAMIASALKKLLNTHVHFRKRVSVEEQRAQKYDRFFRGRQSCLQIFEHFRPTGAHEAVQRHSDLFKKRLQKDDVQDFETRWDQALKSASEVPTDVILEGMYKSKL